MGNGGAECLKEEKKLEKNEKKTKLKENIYLEWGRDTDRQVSNDNKQTIEKLVEMEICKIYDTLKFLL